MKPSSVMSVLPIYKFPKVVAFFLLSFSGNAYCPWSFEGQCNPDSLIWLRGHSTTTWTRRGEGGGGVTWMSTWTKIWKKSNYFIVILYIINWIALNFIVIKFPMYCADWNEVHLDLLGGGAFGHLLSTWTKREVCQWSTLVLSTLVLSTRGGRGSKLGKIWST